MCVMDVNFSASQSRYTKAPAVQRPQKPPRKELQAAPPGVPLQDRQVEQQPVDEDSLIHFFLALQIMANSQK